MLDYAISGTDVFYCRATQNNFQVISLRENLERGDRYHKSNVCAAREGKPTLLKSGLTSLSDDRFVKKHSSVKKHLCTF